MTVKDFFNNGGVVRCESADEDAAVIAICLEEEIPVYAGHNSYSPEHYWGLTMFRGHIVGYMEGSSGWCAGTPYHDFLALCGKAETLSPVDDLI